MLLSEIDIVFMVRKANKGQAIANYLVDQPLNDPNFTESLFRDKDVLAVELEPSNVELWRWKLYFDEAANSTGKGSGSSSSIPKGPTNPCFSQAKFQLHEQCHRVRGMHGGLTSHLSSYDLSVF